MSDEFGDAISEALAEAMRGSDSFQAMSKSIADSVIGLKRPSTLIEGMSVSFPFAQWIIDIKRYRSRYNKDMKGCEVIGLYFQQIPLTICHLFVIKGTEVYEAYGVSRLKPGDTWSEEGGRAPAYGRAMCKIEEQMKGPKYRYGFILNPGGMTFGKLSG
ncbi:MAG: hypothetical protein WC822_06320 [Candidatus Paceibacterota bacterium]